jgi:hypothetical protein
MQTVLQEREVPEAMRSLSTFDDPQYEECFVARSAEPLRRSPEWLARTAVEESPATRRAGPLVWRALGLRLGPRPSPDHIAGWRIAARGDDWIRIETGSWFASVELVVRVHGSELHEAMFIRYDHPAARLIWPPVSVFHRRAMPSILRYAVKRA